MNLLGLADLLRRVTAVRQVIVSTLVRNGGHRVRTARDLDIGVRTLGLKLKKWKEQKLVADTL